MVFLFTGVWTLEKKGIKPEFEVTFEGAKATPTHMALVALERAGVYKLHVLSIKFLKGHMILFYRKEDKFFICCGLIGLNSHFIMYNRVWFRKQ